VKKNHEKIKIPHLMLCIMFGVSGCAANGQQNRADVYKAGQVNTAQEANTVKILAVLPAQIEVDNSQQKKQAQVGGAVLGAILGGVAGNAVSNHSNKGTLTAGGAVVGGGAGLVAGSMVDDKTLVPGVSLTYVLNSRTLHSAQVGRLCEFEPGKAIMISTKMNETRIQPNAACPPDSN
jgi:outer membrane lipoprotein SlyB